MSRENIFYVHNEDDTNQASYFRQWSPLDTLQTISLFRQSHLPVKWAKSPSELRGHKGANLFINTTPTDAWQCPRTCLNELAQLLSQISQDENHIFLMGYHGSLLPEQLLNDFGVDAIIRGEPEETCLQLAENENIEQVLGISYWKNGEVQHNPDRPLIDLKELPLPAFDLTDPAEYFFEPMNWKRFAVLEHSRGCTFNCYFCAKDIMYGKGIRFNARKNTIRNMLYARECGYRHIYFNDLRFTDSREEARLLCEEMIDSQVDMTWGCEVKVDDLNQDLILKMKEAGCRFMAMGIENDQFAREKKKFRSSFTLENAVELIRFCEESGIKVLAYYMVSEGALRPADYATFNLMHQIPSTFANITRESKFLSKTWFKENLYQQIQSPQGARISFELMKFFLKPHRLLSILQIYKFFGALKAFGFFLKLQWKRMVISA